MVSATVRPSPVALPSLLVGSRVVLRYHKKYMPGAISYVPVFLIALLNDAYRGPCRENENENIRLFCGESWCIAMK